MYERENALREWLTQTIKHSDYILTPLAGDASFRRYFRVHYDGITQVVMDAPPDKENLVPFVHVAKQLTKASLHTPVILAANVNDGFLLLSDLGDMSLLAALTPDAVDGYYREAIQGILKMQTLSIDDPQLPPFNHAFMMGEMSLCTQWFLEAYLSLHLTQEEMLLIKNTMEWIATEVAKQPKVFIHRDYHSRNLMILDPKTNALGVIDFQDAMIGPITYDLVSLLKDCYISWPRERVLEWVGLFHAQSTQAQTRSLDEFIYAFDLCGLQRHLKVLGVFSRLYLRDNKPGYLNDLPLTLRYTLECCKRYEALHPLLRFFQNRVTLA